MWQTLSGVGPPWRQRRENCERTETAVCISNGYGRIYDTRIGCAPSPLVPPGTAPCLPTGPARRPSRQTREEEGICCFASTSGHGRRVVRVGLLVRLPRVPLHRRRRRRGGHAPTHGDRRRAVAYSRLPLARQPVTEAAPLRSEYLLDSDARQRDVDANAKSTGNAQRLQLQAATQHHREVVSRGGHQAFLRPSDGFANAEASVVGMPADRLVRHAVLALGQRTGPPYQHDSRLMDTPLP